jgi:hypothetical protein
MVLVDQHGLLQQAATGVVEAAVGGRQMRSGGLGDDAGADALLVGLVPVTAHAEPLGDRRELGRGARTSDTRQPAPVHPVAQHVRDVDDGVELGDARGPGPQAAAVGGEVVGEDQQECASLGVDGNEGVQVVQREPHHLVFRVAAPFADDHVEGMRRLVVGAELTEVGVSHWCGLTLPCEDKAGDNRVALWTGAEWACATRRGRARWLGGGPAADWWRR